MVPPAVQVAKGIFSIGPIVTKRRTGTNSPFLVVGERVAIVEPGEETQAPEFLEGVKALGVDFNRIDYIIPSHIHTHHVTAVNVLLEEIPHAKMVVHYRGAPHVIDPTRLNESTAQVWGEGRCSVLNPVPQDKVIVVKGGEVFDLGGRELEIIDATGHAPHQIAIFDRLTRGMWAGDCCDFTTWSKRGSTNIQPPIFDVQKNVDTLRRLRAFKPLIMFKWRGSITHYSPDELLQGAEEDVLAIEQIALEGMKQKLTAQKIGRKVWEYRARVRAGGSDQERAEESVEQEPRSGLVGLYRYLLRKYPDLEMPKGVSSVW